MEAVDRSQRRISLASADLRRSEDEEAATMKDYNQKATEEPQNLGTLGDELKKKIEQKDK